jgi:hypothetical protein
MALPQFDITLSVLADGAATLDFDGGRGLGRELVLATHGLVMQGTLIGPGAHFRAIGRCGCAGLDANGFLSLG